MVTRSEARIAKLTDLTPSVRLFTLEPSTPLSFKAGQFLNLFFQEGETKHRKPYSIASSPYHSDAIELCIKYVPGGRSTPALFNLSSGDTVQLMGGMGLFCLDHATRDHLVFAGAGTGVAPLRSMIYELLAQGSKQSMTLILGVRHESEILFQEEFATLAQQYPQFTFIPVISRPAESWDGKTGYVQDHFEGFDQENTQFFLCGLPQMIEDAKNRLLTLGYTQQQIHEEKFV